MPIEHITLGQGVATQIENDIIDWWRPYTCESIVIADETLENDCPKEADIRKDLQRILKDNKLDRVEAPAFYAMMQKLAGSDLVLDLKEASRTTLKLTLSPLGKYGDTLTDSELENDVAKVYASSPLLLRSIAYNLTDMFSQDITALVNIGIRLGNAREELETTIELAEATLKELQGDTSSFWSFMSAENMLGLSAQFTSGGNPFSNMELEGVMEFLSRLRTISAGLDSFEDNLARGILNTDSPEITAFLKSPFGYLSNVASYFRQPEEQETEKEKVVRFVNFISGIIGIAMDSRAERLASFLGDAWIESLGDIGEQHRGIIEERLRSGIFRWADGSFRRFANAVASYDSIALLTTGGVAGKLLAKIPKIRTTISTLRNVRSLRRTSRLIPGVPLLAAKTGEKIIGLGGAKVLLNLGTEYGKFRSYITVGSVIGGEEGRDMAAKLYLFIAGASIAYGDAANAAYAEKLLDGKVDFLKELSNKNWDRDQIDDLIEQALKAGQHRSFKLPKNVAPHELAKRLLQAKSKLDAIFREEARISKLNMKIDNEISNFRAYLAEHPDLNGKEFLAQARAISEGTTDRFEALTNLKKFITEARGVPKNVGVGSPVRYTNVLSGGKRAVAGKSASKGGSKDVGEASVSSAKPAPLKPIAKYELSQQAETEIHDIFLIRPSFREAYSNAMKHLVERTSGRVKGSNNWKYLKGSNEWEGRIGGYRIICKYNSNTHTYTVESVTTRQTIGTKRGWSSR